MSELSQSSVNSRLSILNLFFIGILSLVQVAVVSRHILFAGFLLHLVCKVSPHDKYWPVVAGSAVLVLAHGSQLIFINVIDIVFNNHGIAFLPIIHQSLRIDMQTLALCFVTIPLERLLFLQYFMRTIKSASRDEITFLF